MHACLLSTIGALRDELAIESTKTFPGGLLDCRNQIDIKLQNFLKGNIVILSLK